MASRQRIADLALHLCIFCNTLKFSRVCENVGANKDVGQWRRLVVWLNIVVRSLFTEILDEEPEFAEAAEEYVHALVNIVTSIPVK